MSEYTADELRKEALYWQAKADRIREMGATKFTVQQASDLAHAENADELLRAGADAMDAAKSWEAQSERNCREMNLTKNALAKAEARVKELEQHLANMCNCADEVGVNHFDTDTMDEYVERMQTCTLAARSALQVKP